MVIKGMLFDPTIPLKQISESELQNSCLALKFCYESVDSFYEIYLQRRKGKKGTTEHRDQDLLRAMLLFSSAGLDAVIKQLINDALIKVIENDSGAFNQFEKLIERKLKKSDLPDDFKSQEVKIDYGLLVAALTSRNPRLQLITALQQELVSNSLQSKDELIRIASIFAITLKEIIVDEVVTKQGFNIRNEITHEMDIDFTKKLSKKRQQRTEKLMLKHTNNMLQIALKFVQAVARKLSV